MYCRNCGKELANNEVYCPNCGMMISNKTNSVAKVLEKDQNKLENTSSFLSKISVITMIVSFHSFIALIGLIIGIISIVISLINKVKHNVNFNGLTLAMSISGIITNLMIFVFLMFLI